MYLDTYSDKYLVSVSMIQSRRIYISSYLKDTRYFA